MSMCESGVSNSGPNEDLSRNQRTPWGLHYDADATVAVSEP